VSTDYGGSMTTQKSSGSLKRIGFVALILVLALAGTLFLYWEAPQLPFFFDDMIHMRWLDGQTLPSIWTTAEGLGYYRPLTMSVWKVDHLLFGDNDPARLHTLNLLLHALNAVLAGGIAWRAYLGKGRIAFSLLTVALFVTFPFSYQAVPSTSSLSKPLIATLTLASVLLYWEARRRHSLWLAGLSLFVGFLAPFAYETGVVVPLAILATEAFGYFRKEFERFSLLPILFMLLIWGIALPLVVLLEPETGASLRIPNLLDLWQNGVYFLQGLVFPTAPLASPLVQILPVDEFVLIAIIELLTLVALFLFYRWVDQLKLFWYALSWFVVGVLPLWLMLDFAYVITSPRILYLGAVGSVLLWAGVPVFLWSKLPNRWWPKALVVVAVVGMLALGVAYVRQKMTLASAVAKPLWKAVQVIEEQEQPAPVLYLNVPAWVAPKESTYRVGTEGLTFIPEYVRVRDFVYINADQDPRIRTRIFDPVKQDWEAYIGYAGNSLDWNGLEKEIRRGIGVYLTTYSEDGLGFVEAGALEQSGAELSSDGAFGRFGDQVVLLKHEVETTGNDLVVTLWWDAQQVSEEDTTVFLHVYDEAGQLVAQGDGYPLQGLFPAQRWQPGDVVRDVRYLTLPEGAEDQPYTIVVGWYNTATGQRLPAFDQQEQPATDDAIQLYP